MLTPYLEKLIHEKKAAYREFPIGGSGVGTIPVQTNHEVVITDFTWNPFCDVPTEVILQGTIQYAPIIRVDYVPGVGVPQVGDTLNLFNAGAVLIGTAFILQVFAGTLTLAVTGGDATTLDNYVDTTHAGSGSAIIIFSQAFTIPETLVNQSEFGEADLLADAPIGAPGLSPGVLTVELPTGSFLPNDELIGLISGAQALQTGALTPASFAPPVDAIPLLMANSIHHLRFKSKGIEAIYNFRDTVEPILVVPVGQIDMVVAGYRMGDPIQVHTYIYCSQTVQIDIWKFSPSGNTFTQGNPPAISDEPAVPNGYTNAVANPPVLNILTGEGARIRPLGGSREQVANTPRTKDQFNDDIGNLTELNLPINNLSFPLVNIGYVEIYEK